MLKRKLTMWYWLQPLAVFAFFLVLYALTAQRGVSWQDSGEFQYRVTMGDYHWHSGIARAHPLYIFLARRFAALFPPGAGFYAVNLFSGVGMALALALLAATVRRLTKSARSTWVAVAALGLSHMAWWMSTTAEVYTWSLAALMAEIYCLTQINQQATQQDNGAASPAPWLMALFAANGTHAAIHNFAFVSLPLYVAILLCELRCTAGGKWRTRHWLWLAGAVAAWGAGATMLLVQAVEMWLDSGRLTMTFKSVLFGTGYEQLVMGIVPQSWKLTGANWLLAGVSLLNPVWLLTIRGLTMYRKSGRLAVWLLVLTVAHAVFWVRYFVPDQATFILPVLGLLAIWAGLGAMEVLKYGGYIVLKLGAIAIMCSIAMPCLLKISIEELGIKIPRAREVPYRDETRYWLLPWKQNEDSAASFVATVATQLGADDWLVADATTAGPLMAARAAGQIADDWRLITPWSEAAEDAAARAALAAGARVYVVSPVEGYAPTWLLVPELQAVKEGALWLMMRAKMDEDGAGEEAIEERSLHGT